MISHRGIQQNQFEYRGKWYGHVRLPIQTLDTDEMQPHWVDEDKFFMFNGEIFNYNRERYDSDTDYLEHFFADYNTFEKLTGNDALAEMNRWDGFWAITFIYGDEIIAFTDPLGKKQLYYNDEGEVCSEISPLVGNRQLDQKFLSTIRKFGYNMDDLTPYRGVKRFLPNKIYSVKRGMITTKDDYYSLYSKPRSDDLFELMMTSVQNRLITRKYRIGMFLSGGLDSTIITGLLEKLNANVNYYSIENGEKEFVDIAESYYKIDVEYLTYNEEERESIYRWNETPIDLGSVVPQFNLFSNAKERIILSGDGADELFGGYRRINEYDSQKSDVFDELTFYHLPRLDRASMRYTIELRNPFLSHDVVRFALGLDYGRRFNKNILKEVFSGFIPKEIRERVKVPLKTKAIAEDRVKARLQLVNDFIEWRK